MAFANGSQRCFCAVFGVSDVPHLVFETCGRNSSWSKKTPDPIPWKFIAG